MSKQVHLICVGKLKKSELKILENDYLKRSKRFLINIIEIKASSESNCTEAKNIENKIKSLGKNINIWLLDEKGETCTSKELAAHVDGMLSTDIEPVYVIGGALGHTREMKEKYQALSLSSMTLPHQLARLFMVEQLYRAETIMTKHPYHNT